MTITVHKAESLKIGVFVASKISNEPAHSGRQMHMTVIAYGPPCILEL